MMPVRTASRSEASDTVLIRSLSYYQCYKKLAKRSCSSLAIIKATMSIGSTEISQQPDFLRITCGKVVDNLWKSRGKDRDFCAISEKRRWQLKNTLLFHAV